MKIGLCILFYLVLSGLRAQDPDASQNRRLYLTVSAGVGLVGPKHDIEEEMRASGLGDTGPSGNFFGNYYSGSGEHPKSGRIPTLSIAVNSWLKSRRGIALETGLVDFIEVNGYDNVGIGNYMFLRSSIWSTSMNYMLGSQNRKRYLSIGPTLLLHHVKDKAKGSTSDAQNNWLLGINASYSAHLIDKSDWFLALKASSRIAPNSEIGPFVTEHQTGRFTTNQGNHRSEFNQTKVQVSGINLGLTFGIKQKPRSG